MPACASGGSLKKREPNRTSPVVKKPTCTATFEFHVPGSVSSPLARNADVSPLNWKKLRTPNTSSTGMRAIAHTTIGMTGSPLRLASGVGFGFITDASLVYDALKHRHG